MNWTQMDAMTFDPKCRQTQTAFLLVTDTGASVAPDARDGQLDLFAVTD